ncbi:hypothetical protein ACIQRK_37095 [Streptomyces anulatus]
MARDAGLKGLLAKRLTYRYEPGVRSKAWPKIKVHHFADFVIGGWMPGRGRLNGLPGAVLVGERREGLLHYAGSVGTGLSVAERARLAELRAGIGIGIGIGIGSADQGSVRAYRSNPDGVRPQAL